MNDIFHIFLNTACTLKKVTKNWSTWLICGEVSNTMYCKHHINFNNFIFLLRNHTLNPHTQYINGCLSVTGWCVMLNVNVLHACVYDVMVSEKRNNSGSRRKCNCATWCLCTCAIACKIVVLTIDLY
jgi:hypothetical protein